MTAQDESVTSAESDADVAPTSHHQLEPLDPRQIAAWRAMSPARRLELAFQTYPCCT